MVQTSVYMLKQKFLPGLFTFPMFKTLWFHTYYAISYFNKPTNKLCFNLKNNTVYYYWFTVFFLINPYTPCSLYTHTQTYTLTCTAQKIYISKIYTRGRTFSQNLAVFTILMTIRIACEHMDFLSLRSKASIDQMLKGFV